MGEGKRNAQVKPLIFGKALTNCLPLIINDYFSFCQFFLQSNCSWFGVNVQFISYFKFLQRFFWYINRTFSGTRAEAADPLQAAGVYKNIVLAVENAREAANKAVEESEHTLSMVTQIVLYFLKFN